MREERGTFPSFDGLRLAYRLYEKPGSDDLMVICHGHGEHSGRYRKFSDVLENENLSIASFDFRGSGLSEGREVYVETLEDYLQDLTAYIVFLRGHCKVPVKVILFGHSLGGLVALHWAMRQQDSLRMLILSSPCLGLKLPGILRSLNSLLHRFAPGFLYQNPVYPPHLSHDPREIEVYKKDGLIKRKMSVRLLSEMLRYMDLLDEEKTYLFSFPVYVLSAGLEKVVDADKTQKVFESFKTPDKDYRVFDGFYHEIFNELYQDQAFDALKGYLDRGRKVTA
ncbi:MAG: lysophospholipase [Candidatus Omnitrophota bacterium]|nr:lysophospholipase [Candidatus Omnitrophota bacterium]